MSSAEKTCASCGKVYKTEADYLSETSQWRICDMQNLWFNCKCNSTLMIRKGKYDWYSPDKLMSTGAASIFNKVSQIKDLPRVPAAIMNLQTMLKDENSHMHSIVKEVKRDPFLAAEILKMAEGMKNLRNPSQTKIEALEHAISYIGRNTLGDMVLAISIKKFKPACPMTYSIKPRNFIHTSNINKSR